MQLIVTLWQGLCSLPRAWHPMLGMIFGKFLYYAASKRRKIAKANIAACFPLLSSQEKLTLLHQNFYYLGSSILDTGIAWFWSDAKIQLSLAYEIKGVDYLLTNTDTVGNLVLFKHSQHLELDARLLGLNSVIYGVGRSHNSKAMDKLQNRGRHASIKGTVDKNNPRKFIKWLKEGKNVMYAIDQDYGWENSIKLMFFNQEAATITTTEKIATMTQCNLLFLNSYYKNNKLILDLGLIDIKGLDSMRVAQKINDLMESKILQHPAEYLWAHRRFKSTLGKEFYK